MTEAPMGSQPSLWQGAVRLNQESVCGDDPCAGVPIARLVAWQAPTQPVAAPGAMRGQITLSDDFDAPLDGLFELQQ